MKLQEIEEVKQLMEELIGIPYNVTKVNGYTIITKFLNIRKCKVYKSTLRIPQGDTMLEHESNMFELTVNVTTEEYTAVTYKITRMGIQEGEQMLTYIGVSTDALIFDNDCEIVTSELLLDALRHYLEISASVQENNV